MNTCLKSFLWIAGLIWWGEKLSAQNDCEQLIWSTRFNINVNADSSLAYGMKACSVCEEKYGKLHQETATANLLVGQAYIWMGQFHEAYPYLVKAQAISDALPKINSGFSVDLLLSMGQYLRYTGRYDDAEIKLKAALAIADSLFKVTKAFSAIWDSRCGVIWNELGVVYGRQAMEELSSACFLKSLEIARKYKNLDPENYYVSLINVAEVERNRGNYFEAIEMIEEARAQFGVKSVEYGQILIYQSGIQYLLGDFESAEATIQEAMKCLSGTWGRDSDPYLQALIIWASILDDKKEYKKAIETMLDAIQTCSRIYQKADKMVETTIKGNLCIYYDNDGQRSLAKRCYEDVLAERRFWVGENHSNYALALRNFGAFYFKNGEYLLADSLYTRALDIYRTTSDTLNFDFLDAIIDAGWLKEAAGRSEEARSLYLEMNKYFNLKLKRNIGFLSEKQKERFLKQNQRFPNTFFSFVSREYAQDSAMAGLAYDNVLNLKGLIYASQKNMFSSIDEQQDTALSELLEKWKKGKLLLSSLISVPKQEQLLNTDSLNSAIEDTEKKLALKSKRFQQITQDVNWQTIEARLGPGEAAIEFHHFKYKNKGPGWSDSTLYIALVLRTGWKHPRFVPLCTEAQLQKALDARNATGIQDKLEKLYGDNGTIFPLVWQPLENLLNGVTKIWYAPSGLLHNVAFSALQNPNYGYLIQQYQLERLTSTRELSLQSPEFAGSDLLSAVLFGGIRFDSSVAVVSGNWPRQAPEENRFLSDSAGLRGSTFHYLPYTGVEIREIYKILTQKAISADTLSGFDATEGIFRGLGARALSPGIIHVATHGFAYAACQRGNCDTVSGWRSSANPLFRSGLAFAGANKAGRKTAASSSSPGANDGLLFAFDIADLNLRNTRLAVLSACGTALGEIQGSEGVYGLQRAFKLAGAEHLIISLWSVPDKHTKDFMLLFYRNWLNGKLPLSLREAFIKTQRDAVGKIPLSAWAAFVLI